MTPKRRNTPIALQRPVHRALLSIAASLLLVVQPGTTAAQDDETVIERSESQLPFLTLRNLATDAEPSDRFGGERSALRAGYCHTRSTHLSWLRDANASSPIALPEGYTQVVDVTLEDPADILANIAAKQPTTRPVLYVHGYNEGFARSCRRAARLQDALDRTDTLILFSWPSNGKPAHYTQDEADIGWSESGLYQAMLALQTEFGHGGYDVIAHSLGSRAVMRTLSQVGRAALGRADSSSKASNSVAHAVFVASDVDAGLFSNRLRDMSAAAGRVSVLANDQDLPLKLSEELHGAPRLGQTGAHLDALSGVDVYDLSDLGMRGSTGHLYHLNHPRIHRLLQDILARPANQSTADTRVQVRDD